ncbi:MAG: Response regulator uvrY, partial [Bacteroidota bacterium]
MSTEVNNNELRLRVAIVDDHTLFRKGITEILQQLNIDVVGESPNGEDYMLKAATISPEVVLMDIHMPGKDGIDTTRWLAKNHPQQKVIALTMTDEDLTIIRMIRAGAKGYLLKDVSPEELNLAITEVARNNNYYGSGLPPETINIAENGDINISSTGTEKLTARELEFLEHCCSDMSYKEIAEKMNVMIKTI